MTKRILVLCTANSCRSQIVHGYLTHFGGDYVEVFSAGVNKQQIHPRAIQIMKEDGIDISHHTVNHVDEYRNLDFDYVITVCDDALETCPYVAARVRNFHHHFPDPAKATGNEEQIMSAFRMVRDIARRYTRDFIKEYVNVSS